jgi:hypothetical protein
VSLHRLPLAAAEGAGLRNTASGTPILPNIMQQRAALYVDESVLWHLHLLRNRGRQVRDTFGVAFGRGVLCIGLR